MPDTATTPLLTIKLLGGLVIEKGSARVTGLVTQKAEVLVAYLSCHPRAHRRDVLATMLWDNRTQKQALSNLRTLLTSLRRHLRPYLAVSRKTLSLDWDQPIWVDVGVFEDALSSLMPQAPDSDQILEDPSTIEDALNLYRGDFLEGVFVDDSRGVDAWMAARRERLQHMAMRAHEQLAVYYLHHRRYDAGIRHARNLIGLDPLHEDAHRLLMRLLARNGRRNAALAQYEACRRLLQAEVGTEPDAETIALQQRIARGRAQVRHDFPLAPTPFVGRIAELAAISRRLDDGDCRLLTLAGPGGAGKTRLALEAAQDRRDDYLDGVVFVNLAPVSTAHDVPSTIAGALNLPLVQKQPSQVQLLDYLRDREILLLLDNFEHLLDHADGDEAGEALALVQTIVEIAPRVKLLITSRHRLRLQAEWVLTVNGLQRAEASKDSGRGKEDAARLFASCARRARAGFDPGDGDAVAHVCQLVDGLPLAIELAAASLIQHDLDEIIAGIQRNLDFLAGGMRDAPARHRSLRATFDHSWALLDPASRETFRRLSVFRGPFDLEAATAAADATEMALNNLAAWSLLRHEGTRYDIHQVLRQFAQEKMAEKPQVERETRKRHSAYMLQLVQDRESALFGADAHSAQQTITSILDDVRAAWQWAVLQHNWQAIDGSLEALTSFHSLSGMAEQGQRLVRAAIEEVEGAGANAQVSALGGRLMASAARLLVEQGKNDEALTTVERALEISPRAQVQIAARFQAGRALWRTGHFDEALTELEVALSLCAHGKHAESRIRGDILRTLGITTMHLGDYEQAEAYYSQALEADRATGSRRGEAIALNQFGRIVELQGDFRRAREYYERALPHFQMSGFRRGEIAALINLGNTLRRLGSYTPARDHLRRALALTRQTNDRYQESLTLYNLGILHHLLGDMKAARRRSEQALRLVRQAEYQQGEGNSLYILGNIALSCGDLSRAERLAQEALAIFREIDSPYGEASAHTLLGRIALRDDHLQEAAEHIETALSMGRTIHSLHIVADAMAYQSLYLLRAREPEEALRQARESVSTAQETGVQQTIGDALTILGHAHVAAGESARAHEVYSRALTLRRDTGQHHLTPEPLAGLARAALATDDLEEALTYVDEILAYLEDHPLHGPEEPGRILDICHHILVAADDPRATSLK